MNDIDKTNTDKNNRNNMNTNVNKNINVIKNDKDLKIISLGGFGHVTQNMYLYETPKDILIVDCGVGFPEEEMMGVDLVIPDISYLEDKKDKIRGIVLSHGHDDHIGALPYLLPKLPDNLPVYGPRWAIALTKLKLQDFSLKANLKEFDEQSRLKLGAFSLSFIKVTHSIPDTFHLVIETPLGIFYHAADFKLDLNPVIGQPSNQDRMKQVGEKGVTCLLSDCLRAENPGFTPPEAELSEMFTKEIADCKGKFLVTTISSNISRLKQAVDVSIKNNRKVVLVGRSIEKSFEIAQKLKYIEYPANTFVKKKEIKRYPPHLLTLLVAGSQGQVGSSLDRIVADEMDLIKVESGDKIIFSTDYIPGNETAIYSLIDNLYRLGAEVVYQDIRSNIHVSGHGSQEDLAKLMKMLNPKYLLPIGGNYRHIYAYQRLAQKKGFNKDQVIMADSGQVVHFNSQGLVDLRERVEVRQVMVDALGIGDVGNIVLRDRKILAEEGMVVAIIPFDQSSCQLIGDPEVVSRGFVYIKDNLPLLKQAQKRIKQLVRDLGNRRADYRFIRRKVQGELEEFFFKNTGRRPMVLVVMIEA